MGRTFLHPPANKQNTVCPYNGKQSFCEGEWSLDSRYNTGEPWAYYVKKSGPQNSFWTAQKRKPRGFEMSVKQEVTLVSTGFFFWGWCNILELDGDGYIIFGNYWVPYFKRIIFMVHELQLDLKNRKKCVVACEF